MRIDTPSDKKGVDVQYTALIGNGMVARLYVDTRRTDITEKITQRNDIHVNLVGPEEKGKGWGGRHALAYFQYMLDEGQFIAGDHSTDSFLHI